MVMLLTNNNSIKEVILFPSMKKIQAGEDDTEHSAEKEER
jgi:aspartyl-tRNA synthetase